MNLLRSVVSLILEGALLVFMAYWLPRSRLGQVGTMAAALRARPDDAEIQVGFSRRFISRWWLLALVCAAVLELDGAGLSGAPLQTLNDDTGAPVLAAWSHLVVGFFALTFGLSTLMVAKRAKVRERLLRNLARLGHAWVLFPRTARASVWFCGVAVTAGICEELAFRRLVPVFAARVSGEGFWVPLLLSAISFGAAHRYQGRRGMIVTGLLGLIFYCLFAVTGSLAVAMTVHALIDLRVAAMYPAIGAVPVPGSEPSLAAQRDAIAQVT